MKPKTILSEKVIFRLTTEEYQRLAERAVRERRSLSNLVWLLVVQALDAEERQHGHPFETSERATP